MDYFSATITGFALGAAARSLIPFGLPALGFILLLACVSFFFWLVGRARLLSVAAVFLVFTALGAGRVMLAPQALPEAFVPLIDTDATLEGVIAADPDIRETSQRVTVAVGKDGEKTRVLAVLPLYPELSYGEKIEVSGLMQKPEPFATDGGRTFRYDRYLQKDGIFALMPRASVRIIAPPSGFFTRSIGMLYEMKNVFVRGLENALPEPHAALAEGLLTGGKQGLGKPLLDAFTVSGLVQIVVLSGYNVMIVAESIMKSLAFLPKRIGYAGAALGIIGFIIAAGSGSSAVRAGIMACLALYARASRRSYDALRALSAAVFLMLLYNPFYLTFDPGFQLSCAATIGLIVGTPIVELRLARIRSAFWREAVATTIAAQIAVLPLLLYQTGNLSFVSFLANVLVLPAVPAAMAASFAAGLFGMLAPIIAPVFGIPAYLLLAYIIAIGKYAAALPFAHVIVPAFPFAAVVISYIALFFFVKRLSKRITAPKPSRIALPRGPN